MRIIRYRYIHEIPEATKSHFLDMVSALEKVKK